MYHQLQFLGTGDSQGVPRWWCDCEVCTEARTTGRNARSRPSALCTLGTEVLLLDCGTDFRTQMLKFGHRRIDYVIITHAHNDHFLGLGDLFDYASWTGHLPQIYAPANVIPEISERFSYAFRKHPAIMPLETATKLLGFEVTAFKVPHGANGYAYGLYFVGPDYRWAYVTDSIHIPASIQAQYLNHLDLLILGTAFWHENAPIAKRSIYDVQEALALSCVQSTPRVYFSHLSHDIDINQSLPEHIRWAQDGLCINLSNE